MKYLATNFFRLLLLVTFIFCSLVVGCTQVNFDEDDPKPIPLPQYPIIDFNFSGDVQDFDKEIQLYIEGVTDTNSQPVKGSISIGDQTTNYKIFRGYKTPKNKALPVFLLYIKKKPNITGKKIKVTVNIEKVTDIKQNFVEIFEANDLSGNITEFYYK
ncbi:MAG: hypothetical protein LBE39_11830 [Flavobacteriaceae bacterium]|jgi:hypothetical protein|nr:hypothetical protein [Flavobacteriaceae bacterium]